MTGAQPLFWAMHHPPFGLLLLRCYGRAHGLRKKRETFGHRGRLMVDVAHVLHTERETRSFRLLAALLAAVTLFVRIEEIPPAPALPSLLLFLVYTMALSVLLPRVVPRVGSPRALTALVLGMALVDGVSVMGIVYFIGGLQAITVILMPLFIIYHTIYLGYSSGIFSVIVFSLLYVGTGFWGADVRGYLPGLLGQVALLLLLPVLSAVFIRSMMLTEARQQGLRKRLMEQAGVHNINIATGSWMVSSGQLLMAGVAPNDGSLGRFLEVVSKTPSIRSFRVTTATPADPGAEGIAFSVAARIRRAPARQPATPIPRPKDAAPLQPSVPGAQRRFLGGLLGKGRPMEDLVEAAKEEEYPPIEYLPPSSTS